MNGPAGTARLRVFRWKPGDRAAHFEEFEVPAREGGTVLDALLAVRRRFDPTLAFRHSCLHASCGTCGVRVDGREALACVTPLPPGRTVTVEPLANAPLAGDLVVDMGDFYARAEPAGRPQVRASELPSPEPAMRFENCIECGLCVSACPVSGGDSGYLGPAALAAAWRVVQEPRGADPAAALAWVDTEQGCWRCHVAFECSEACPAGVDPAGAIMSLRRRLIGDRVHGRRPSGAGGGA
jgi:succinate dehydrogenase iron-sulfur subunit